MLKLKKESYNRIKDTVFTDQINILFALSVLENKVNGSVYVDNVESPSTFYIQHPYGMSLLFGNCDKSEFNGQLIKHLINSNKTRQSYEWLQVYPESWYNTLDELLSSNKIVQTEDELYHDLNFVNNKNTIIQFQRINYKFNKIKYLNQKSSKAGNIVLTTHNMFNDMEGSVIPSHFWNNSEDFISNSIGYSLIIDQSIPVSTAFASFIIGDKLELGVETRKKYGGLGYASLVCSALIDYCIKNNYEPIWSCHAGNYGSVHLANRLGFEETKRIPYYRLPKD